MMDVNDLFIGDYLRITSLGVIGRFNGLEKGMVTVRVGEEIIVAYPDDVELVPDDEVERRSAIVPEEPTGRNEGMDIREIAEFDPVLDLHLQALTKAGHTQHGHESEIDFQLRMCRKYIHRAGALGVRRVKLIHGIGDGILKAEVAHLLESTRAVSDFEPDLYGGAFIVHLIS